MSGRDLARPPGVPVEWTVSSNSTRARRLTVRSVPLRTWFEARARAAVALGVEPHEIAATLECGPTADLPAQTRAAFAGREFWPYSTAA